MQHPVATMRHAPSPGDPHRWVGRDVALTQGRVTGPAPAGQVRLAYRCLGIPEVRRSPGREAFLGTVEVLLDLSGEPGIVGLVRLDVAEGGHRKGLGSRIVAAVLGASKGDLLVHDIQVEADGFWRRMGVSFADPIPNRPLHGVLANPLRPAMDAPEPDEGSERDVAPRP